MPRAFLIKKKQSALTNSGRPLSPKMYSPTSSGIASPTSSNASTSSSSPRNDENDLTNFQTSSPKYSFDRESNQCLDLSMKSLLKEANVQSNKIELSAPFRSPLYHEPPFVSSYSYPGKFAKIADFLRTGEVSKNSSAHTFAPVNVSPLSTISPSSVHISKNLPIPALASPSTAASLFKPVNYSAIETAAPNCHRLAPYSINWSEHFSVNKLVSPTPSSNGSDDSGRGSEHSEDNSLNESGASKYGKLVKKSDRFQCPDCNKSYSTQSGLAKHQEFHCASQVKKSFSCKHCEKVYVSLGALKMHIRTHTLPCKCKLCGKAFSRPWLLQGHIRTHTGEKPFSCQFCNRAFADRSNLRAHLQTHSVVKKYNCKTCSRTFSRMSLLLKHEDNGCNAGARSLSACSPNIAEQMSPVSQPLVMNCE